MSQQNGQLMQSDYTDNTGGINLTDSVFKIKDTQAAGGLNFDYILTGGVRKRLGPTLVNTVADSALRTLGFGLYNTAGGSKSVIRAADTKLQLVDTDTPAFTALSKDTAVAGDPFVVGSTQTVVTSMFNSGTSNILWTAGGGATLPVGAYSTSGWTVNGVAAPTGAIVLTEHAASGGTFVSAGTYRYGVLYRKRSTQALSNLALDQAVTIAATTSTVTVDLSGLTGLDTTLIDQIQIYRSAVNGADLFTTGDLIAELASTDTSYLDTGTFVSSPENIPRAGNLVVDNSTLPTGTYNVMTLFKRRLVTAQDSTLYFSDLNKSESWPTVNALTVPSGGNITALAIVSFTSPQAQTLDELLVVYKEREIWVVTGNDYTDDALKFIDQVGCPAQDLVVTANGYLTWLDYRGIYLWDGTGKPIYCSRPLEPLFSHNGDLDKAKLTLGHGKFYRKDNQVIWYLSSRIYGEQQYAIKMDLRLTLPQIDQDMTGRNLDAVLVQDSYAFPIYAGMSYIPDSGADELLILGDASGYCYFAANGTADGASSAYEFTYLTPGLHMGNPNQKKQFHQAIAWVQDVGNWNLELDYWVDFKAGVANQSTKVLPLSTESQSAVALWDVAYWDAAYYDSYAPNVVPLVFNLDNSQGSAIQLQWRNATADQPITIHGWSIIWSPLGGITQ